RRSKQLGEPHARRVEPAGLIAETGCDESRREAVCGDAATGEPARQLAREQNVAELRRTVHRERAIAARGLQIIEIEMALAVCVRGGIDDAGRRGGDEAVEQAGGQHEVGYVIKREGALEP